MKKILAILAILMFVPFSAFGLEMIHDQVMDEITAQVGITIETNLTIDVNLGAVNWVDSDGLAAYGNNPGTFQFLNTNIGQIAINTGTYGYGIAIDVGCDPSDNYYSSLGTLGEGMPFLRIGLTDLSIGIGNITTDFSGPIDILGVNINSIDGYIDVGGIMGIEDPTSSGSYQSVGIEVNLALAIDSVVVGNIAWTDNDGIRLNNPGTSPARDNDDYQGAVGITGMTLANMGVGGQILIECGTDATSRPAGSQTFLDITLNSLTITTTSGVNMTIALGTSVNNLNEELGQLQLLDMDLVIDGDVQISAH